MQYLAFLTSKPLMIHLRIECNRYDLVYRSGFLRGRGKSEDQDEIPVVTDGELKTLRMNHCEGDKHVHSYTHKYMHTTLPWNFKNRCTCNNYFIRAQRTLFSFVCTFCFVSGHWGFILYFLYKLDSFLMFTVKIQEWLLNIYSCAWFIIGAQYIGS